MPAGGGMDFTYGQQHEVTGGPDAGEKVTTRKLGLLRKHLKV